jgi:hypothetical protein
MSVSEQRLGAALELVAAGDGLRAAARAGRAASAHRRRLHEAEAAWDAGSRQAKGRR